MGSYSLKVLSMNHTKFKLLTTAEAPNGHLQWVVSLKLGIGGAQRNSNSQCSTGCSHILPTYNK